MNIDQISSLIRMGDINRQLGAKVAERGAKATTILRIVIESFSYSTVESVSQAVINLMDLAGSELLSSDDALASKSLSTLDQVIRMRADERSLVKDSLIPYRESKLTKYLMPYLEGDSRMLWLCHVSPTD